MSETFRFRVLETSPREHLLRLILIHPDAALVRPSDSWVFESALEALSGVKPLGMPFEVNFVGASCLRNPNDPFGDEVSPFPEDLDDLSDDERDQFFGDESRLPKAEYRVITSEDLLLTKETTCDVA